jgi:hypothetical protein
MSRPLSLSLTRLLPVPLVALSAAFAVPAQAESMLVSASGVFTPETPVLPFSAPGATWSLSFEVDRFPVPIMGDGNTLPDYYVTVAFSNFRMLLNGVETESASQITLYSGPNAGGMDVVFGEIVPGVGYYSLGTFGAAYYTGSELAPEIAPGSYSTFILDGIYAGQSGIYVATPGPEYWQPATTVTISAVPLPPSAALTAVGLAALALRRRPIVPTAARPRPS